MQRIETYNGIKLKKKIMKIDSFSFQKSILRKMVIIYMTLIQHGYFTWLHIFSRNGELKPLQPSEVKQFDLLLLIS
jgi:hypothetical protein